MQTEPIGRDFDFLIKMLYNKKLFSSVAEIHDVERHTVGKIRLILAEKTEIFREGLVTILSREPSIELVSACRTGLEAIESAQEYQPDVILIDTELSECCALEVMQRINERLPKTSIAVFAKVETDFDLFLFVKVGASAFIYKDTSSENLIKTISLIADGGAVVCPPMAKRLLEEFDFLEKRRNETNLQGVTLTERQRTILSLVAQGLTNKEIANTLHISGYTVKVHVRNVMEKLHVHTRHKAAVLMEAKVANLSNLI